MKSFSTLIAFIILLPFSRGDVWTSVDGRELEGTFLNYDYISGTVSIKRSHDETVFKIPEEQIIHNDRIKALLLEHRVAKPYWYTDYEVAKSKHGDKRCILFSRNGSDAESFELFCHKLLLREDFIRLIDSRDVVICIQDSIPEELNYLRGDTQKLSEWQKEIPLMIKADFRARNIQNAEIFTGFKRLYLTKPDQADPFKKIEKPKFLPLEDIDKVIRRYNRI